MNVSFAVSVCIDMSFETVFFFKLIVLHWIQNIVSMIRLNSNAHVKITCTLISRFIFYTLAERF